MVSLTTKILLLLVKNNLSKRGKGVAHKMCTTTFLRIRVSYSKALKDQEKDIGGMQPEANIKLCKDLNKEGLTT